MDTGEMNRADLLLDEVCSAARSVAVAQGRMMRAVADFVACGGDERSVVAEIALALSVTEYSAAGDVRLARALTSRLPNTLAALDIGAIDQYKASKVADATEMLSDELASVVDERLVGRLAGRNSTAIRRTTNRLVQRVDPEGAEQRAEQRQESRRVDIVHETDAMATLFATLPAAVASAIYTRLDTTAHQLRRGDDQRTLDQLRADTLADLCLGERGSSGAPRADIHVHISLSTLLGGNEPAELAGHGTIPAAVAREIAHRPTSTWRRILTDPATGQITEVGRTRYRPPAAVADLVKARDRECRFPTCHRPAAFTDLDHNHEWQHGGTTSTTNLVALCRRHHRLKDQPGWTYHLHHNGTLTVRTPTGNHHTSPPPTW